MDKDLEYFKDFLENPEAYNMRDFYPIINEWAEYTVAHKDEFNYLEDEEWREIRERVLHALEIKEDLKEELEEVTFKLSLYNDLASDADRIALYKEWLAFMKTNQFEFDFPDEVITSAEAKMNHLIAAVLHSEAMHEKLRQADIELNQSLEEFADALFEHFERTGKRPVLNALQLKNRLKGN